LLRNREQHVTLPAHGGRLAMEEGNAMQKVLIALAASAALLTMSACVTGYESGITYADGFYDNSYGPVWSGYWGPDGAFYYSQRRGRPFVRDDANHFRRDAADGFRAFHMRDWHNRT